MKILKSAIVLLLALMATEAKAQLCEITVPDTAMRHNVYFVRMAKGADKSDLKILEFDSKGKAVYDAPVASDFNTVRIFFPINGRSFEKSFFIEKGKTTKVTFTFKNDALVSKFGGDNVINNEALAAQRNAYMYPEYFLEHDSTDLIADYDRKIAKLEKSHTSVEKIVAKMTNESMRTSVAKDNDCEFLRFSLSMMRQKARAADLDYMDDPAYVALLEKIDVNDPISDSYSLTGTYINDKSRVAPDASKSERGAAQMRTIKQYVTNQAVARTLQSAVIQEVLTEGNDDIDTFMDALKGTVDSTLYKAAGILAKSLKQTQGGMAAPVCEFTDLDGKVFKSSDFAGKLLYIDFWATWCGPCKQEIPHMEKLAEKFKGDDRIAIISISIDTDAKAWETMVKRDQPSWPQFLAKGAQQAALTTAWGINSIPRFILINPDGTINMSNAFRPSDPQAEARLRALLK